MPPVCDPTTLLETQEMGNEPCAAEKMTPDPLLGSQGTQTEQNGETHAVTVPAQRGRRSSRDAAGLLAGLRPWARRWAVQSLVLNLVLILLLLIFILITIVILTTQPEKTYEPGLTGAACPEGWFGYLGKCYYFSEAEANWTDSQKHCSALGASLAGIDTQQEMEFIKRNRESYDHWIGLWRSLGQSWEWTNGTKFNSSFDIRGGGYCAYVDSKGIASSSCSGQLRWVCCRPEGRLRQ